MALPTTLYFLKEDGSMTKIVNAVRWTRKPVFVAGGAYRDTFNAAYLGAAHKSGLPPNAATVATAFVGGFPIGADGADVDMKTSTISDSSITKDTVVLPDEVAHYPWRTKRYVRWLWEFWDASTVGDAMTLTVTTTIGSATITVSDCALLTPGQAISATGIPTGAIIFNFLEPASGSMLVNDTTVKLSHQATASASVAATLTGSNRLGMVWEDEVVDWGSEISFPI
jgi:hypothetical protein